MLKKIWIPLLLLLTLSNSAFAVDEQVPFGVVVQSSGDRANLKRALILASNMHEVLDKSRFEVVVFGPNVKLLSAFSDELPLIQKAQAMGIKVIACGRSLKSFGLPQSDLAPEVEVVPFGAVHIIQRQLDGWQHITP